MPPPDERRTTITEKFAWFAISCLSYGMTYALAKVPGAETYTWVGGAFTFLLIGIMIRQVFHEVNFFGAYTASAFFSMIIMYPLNQGFTALMLVIFVIALIIAIILIVDDRQRRQEFY
jgi:hypothetical protein